MSELTEVVAGRLNHAIAKSEGDIDFLRFMAKDTAEEIIALVRAEFEEDQLNKELASGIGPPINEIVEVAKAEERRRIARALLSDASVEAAIIAAGNGFVDTPQDMESALRAALTAIGAVTEEGGEDGAV